MSKQERPPVIVVVGHIDHGKSRLLDYIRKSNVVAGEAGGITQHISAYEAEVTLTQGKKKRVTFIDTPGHAAFSQMRTRGCNIADVAILIVSAEEGIKPQTLEALQSIRECKVPFVVAINKIDKPEANVEKTKNSLLENEIYLEGLGGDVPYVLVSAETGEGVPELLETLVLLAEVEGFSGEEEALAEGFVVEAHMNPKKGITASLIIKNGTLRSGMYVAAGNASAPVRIMENFLGKPIKEASFSNPVSISGWNELPEAGSAFKTYKNKKEAQSAINGAQIETKEGFRTKEVKKSNGEEEEEIAVIPVVVKADTIGSLEAVVGEIRKIEEERVLVKIIEAGTGNITENDIKIAGGSEGTIILGFNVGEDRGVSGLAERLGVEIQTFDIIYKLTEWLEKLVKERKPKVKTEEIGGKARVLKVFSRTGNKQVVGGEVFEGVLSKGDKVRILRRGEKVGEGSVVELQVQKEAVSSVEKGKQFGAKISSIIEISERDNLEAFSIVLK